MISTPAVVDVPLRTDQDGVIRIGQTRVTLMTIVLRHRARDTPEAIHEGFPTVPLVDVYAVITYYLAHQTEVDQYIEMEQQAGEALRREIESSPHYKPLTREMLQQRLDDKKQQPE